MTANWTKEQWDALEARVRGTPGAPEEAVSRAARKVLRAYSSSFFLVTRFLPPGKRLQVESIYAAVRYPDEVVDTFSVPARAQHALLDDWGFHYERALTLPDMSSRLRNGVPWILSGFADVVRRNAIPHQHYRAFLLAMRRDIEPRPFRSLRDLIDIYIYGSAIVVGYFLAHVYGTASGATMPEAYASATELGTALQLTNFCRDVREDQLRGRLYLPEDLVADHGLAKAVTLLAEEAAARYQRALSSVDVFAPDTRPAIRACINVYRLLNQRILHSGGEIGFRHSVPVTQKLGALPPDKYWRVPMAYLGVL